MHHARTRFVLLALAICTVVLAIFTPYLSLRLSAEWSLYTLPLAQDTHQLEHKMYINTRCHDVRIEALYSSLMTWPELQAFYGEHLRNTRWQYHTGTIDSSGSGKWTFSETDAQKRRLSFTIRQKYQQGEPIPAKESILRVLRNGEAVYEVDLYYTDESEASQDCDSD